MQVGISVSGKIVVDGEVNALNIDTTAEDVGGNTDTLVEFLELFVTFDTFRMLVDSVQVLNVIHLPFLLADT